MYQSRYIYPIENGSFDIMFAGNIGEAHGLQKVQFGILHNINRESTKTITKCMFYL